MIKSKQDMREYIESDNAIYRPWTKKQKLITSFAQYPTVALRKFLRFLHKQEYYINTANGSKLKGLLGLYSEWKKNRLGNRIGENFKLHGANCIGNSGKTKGALRIGNNMNIGYGAVVIGDIEIANDVVIGANAVANKSVTEPGAIVAGVPAKAVKTFCQREV